MVHETIVLCVKVIGLSSSSIVGILYIFRYSPSSIFSSNFTKLSNTVLLVGKIANLNRLHKQTDDVSKHILFTKISAMIKLLG